MPRAAATTRKTTKTPAKPVPATRGRRAAVEEKQTPRTKGTNPRATSTNPRAKGTNPRAGRTAAAPAKKAPATRGRTRVAAPVQPAPLTGNDKDEVTGFIIGSDVHIVAVELQNGGADRQEIIDRVRGILPEETRNGTAKPIANIVGSVVRKPLERGFTVESSYALVPPAPEPVKKTRGRR